MAKKPEPFNNPFKSIKLQKPEPPKKASAPPPRAPEKKKPSAEEDEALLFRQSVGSVERVRRGPGVVAGGPPPTDKVRIQSEDEEVLEHLALLVGGVGEFEIADSSEFLEGSITGLDRRIVQKLKRGEFELQGSLDLHGMIKTEAKAALEKFILDSRRAGKRCVRVVHGRGLHSQDQIPVLKTSVQVWLSQGRIAKEVIAFASARPQDGGAGAVYVLLRR